MPKKILILFNLVQQDFLQLFIDWCYFFLEESYVNLEVNNSSPSMRKY